MSRIDDLNEWMITEGRQSGDPIAVVSRFATCMIEAGVPLWRANIGQRFANPLLVAWGVVWTPEGTEVYDVTHALLLTDEYIGSSFETITLTQRPLHKSLRNLDPETEHASYLEFASAGATDFYATLLDYGDGSQHGCTFATRTPAGFAPEHLEMIEAAKPGLSSALEPVTMRKSSKSLLRTYLGDGPSDAVWKGTIQRGERRTLDAVVMFSDLRGFTAFSDRASEDAVFETLNGYFDTMVQAVEENGGDVLKFMGDGVLSIFPIVEPPDWSRRCRDATRAAESALASLHAFSADWEGMGKTPLDVGIGMHAGKLSYGNIGSPGRLDFTVVGSTVNLASRIERLTKSLGHRVLASQVVARAVPELFLSLGQHKVHGLTDPVEVFGLRRS
ncbi:MAG: adenylate/guanylate cyclase domain-containing protein [Pseudomonadota bacterium]